MAATRRSPGKADPVLASTRAVSDEYDGVKRGDACKITGEHGLWTFLLFVYNRKNGATWVEVTRRQKDEKARANVQGVRCFDKERMVKSG